MNTSRLVLVWALMSISALAQDPLPNHFLVNSATPLTSGGYGTNIVALGDLDQDGFDDYAVSAPDFDSGSGPLGRVYIYSGRSSLLLRTLDGVQAAARFGHGMADLGDVNSDGIHDIAISAPNYDDAVIGANAGQVTCYSGATGLPLWSAVGDQVSSNLGEALGTIGTTAPFLTASVVVGQSGYSPPSLSGAGRVVYLDPATGQVQGWQDGLVTFDGMGKTLAARSGSPALYAGSSGGRVFTLGGPLASGTPPTLLISPIPGSNSAPLLTMIQGSSAATSGLVMARSYFDSNGFFNNGRVEFLSGTSITPLLIAEGGYTNEQVGLRLTAIRDMDADGDEEIGYASGPPSGFSDLRFSVLTTSSLLRASYLSTGASPARFASIPDTTGDGRGEILQATASGLSQRFDARMLSQGLQPGGMSTLMNGALHFIYDIDMGAPNAGKTYLQLYTATNYAPGFVYQPGAPIVPIFPDALTDLVISLAGSVLYPDAVGFLDGAGLGQTNAFVEPIVATMFSGATFWTTVCIIDVPNDTITATSNPVQVSLP